MPKLFTLTGALPRDPAIDRWMDARSGALGAIAKHWVSVMRGCGSDVREILHDGRPTVCVGGAAFAYVGAFESHVSVGFFRGAQIADPARLLQGTGRSMRHVKLTAPREIDERALSALIYRAYADIKREIENEADDDAPA